MSTPEIIPEQPQQPEIAPRVEQPIIPERQQQLGVTTPPQAIQPVIGDNAQVLVQPVATTITDDTLSPSLVVPVAVASDEKTLEQGAKGPANLSVTWLDMYWLRQVGKALSSGWRIIFGQK